MSKAKEISALWEQIKPQIDEMIHLCYEVESHAEVTADAYQRGYETAKHECEDCPKQAYTDALKMETYQKGLSDAWETARKIFCTSHGELERIFDLEEDDNGLLWVYHEYTASEAIKKIRAYEQAQKEKEEQIQVGDEVINRDKKAVVTEITDRFVRIMYSDGSGYALFSENMTKTGRHFPEIAEVFAKMKETDTG